MLVQSILGIRIGVRVFGWSWWGLFGLIIWVLLGLKGLFGLFLWVVVGCCFGLFLLVFVGALSELGSLLGALRRY